MTDRRANCSCGALTAACRGEPERVSVCHCHACKRRTGSAFSFNATFDDHQVELDGPFKSFARLSDEGRVCTYHFCPSCGATMAYEIEARPGKITVPAGAFADEHFPAPRVSVYENRRCAWVDLDGPRPET